MTGVERIIRSEHSKRIFDFEIPGLLPPTFSMQHEQKGYFRRAHLSSMLPCPTINLYQRYLLIPTDYYLQILFVSPFLAGFTSARGCRYKIPEMFNIFQLYIPKKLFDVTTNPEDILVYFEMESLFTEVTIRDTLMYIDNIFVKGIYNIFKQCLTNGYFMFKGLQEYFEQLDGVSICNPLSPIVANVFIDKFEDRALNSARFQILSKHFFSKYT